MCNPLSFHIHVNAENLPRSDRYAIGDLRGHSESAKLLGLPHYTPRHAEAEWTKDDSGKSLVIRHVDAAKVKELREIVLADFPTRQKFFAWACTKIPKSVKVLDLSGADLSDLTPLAGLTSLTRLYLSQNQITDYSPLSGLTNLTVLDLANNQITDIGPLAGLTSLTWLGLSFNQITDLTPLAGLTSLTLLDLWSNHISDVTPLSGLTNLEWLNVGNNPISDYSPLAGLKAKINR